jgi:hypothetical protein
MTPHWIWATRCDIRPPSLHLSIVVSWVTMPCGLDHDQCHHKYQLGCHFTCLPQPWRRFWKWCRHVLSLRSKGSGLSHRGSVHFPADCPCAMNDKLFPSDKVIRRTAGKKEVMRVVELPLSDNMYSGDHQFYFWAEIECFGDELQIIMEWMIISVLDDWDRVLRSVGLLLSVEAADCSRRCYIWNRLGSCKSCVTLLVLKDKK